MKRVLSALCVLVSVGLVAPSASAVPPPSATVIYVAIVSDLSPRVAGRPTDFSATLGDADRAPVSGETLTLWLRPEGSASFVEAGHATTDANGAATVWASPDRNVVAHWTYAGNDEHAASTSADYGIAIAPLVTARAHDRTLRRGQRLVVTGRTFPAKSGCRVALWKGRLRPLAAGPRPVRLARTVIRGDGSYRLVRRFWKAGPVHVAVTVSWCDGNARGLSPYLRIRVS